MATDCSAREKIMQNFEFKAQYNVDRKIYTFLYVLPQTPISTSTFSSFQLYVVVPAELLYRLSHFFYPSF